MVNNMYRLVVFDSRYPLTMSDPVVSGQGGSEVFSTEIGPSPAVLNVGRRTRFNHPEVVLDHPGISRKQGRVAIRQDDLSDGLNGVIYQDFGKSKPLPHFFGEHADERKNMLYQGEPVRVFPGESLTFQRDLQMRVEECHG